MFTVYIRLWTPLRMSTNIGDGDHMASSRNRCSTGLTIKWECIHFRAFAQGKATWILNYSWDGDRQVDRRRSDEEPGHVRNHGGSEFLGCTWTFDGGIE